MKIVKTNKKPLQALYTKQRVDEIKSDILTIFRKSNKYGAEKYHFTDEARAYLAWKRPIMRDYYGMYSKLPKIMSDRYYGRKPRIMKDRF